MKTYSKQKREKICNPTRNSNFLKRFKRNVMAIYKKNDDIGAISDNPPNKYPWEVLIFIRIHHDCPFGLNNDENWNYPAVQKDKDDHDALYDLCSGSLITNKGSHENMIEMTEGRVKK